ncbi:MAG: CARDB domain-containing protein [bacterium]
MPNSLLKIDLSALPPSLQVVRSTLYFFIMDTFRREFPQWINLYAVDANPWNSENTETHDIYQWPSSQIIASSLSGRQGWKAFDITEVVQRARQETDRMLSLKWGVEPNIAPLSWDIAVSPSWDVFGLLSRYENSNVRPFVKIVFAGDYAVPDLHLSTSDVQIRPRLAQPGDTVILQAKVHNLGSQEVTSAPVRFVDASGRTIGLEQMTSTLPAFSGVDSVSVAWTVGEGTQRVSVQVDPGNQMTELSEINNTVTKEFTISTDYATFLDDFEEDAFNWTPDFDVPVDNNALEDQPVSWSITAQEGVSYHGAKSVFMFLDGTQDDGTIWIERAFPVEPYSNVTISTEFFVNDPFVGIQQWAIVAYAGVYNPEVEVVFSECQTVPVHDAWKRCIYTKEIFTRSASAIWLALGIWARWEVKATFYFDRVSVTIQHGLETSVEAFPGKSSIKAMSLPRNFPNPFSGSTRIHYTPSQPGTVSIRFFDLLGRQVSKVDYTIFSPGKMELMWDGKSASGAELPNGMYFYSISHEKEGIVTGKMVKVK